jgi:ribosomal protein S18 acetylase RimI-like enzyme
MTENGKPIVTVAYPEQHDQAAMSLARAFVDDPTFKSIVPDMTDPAERARRLPDLFRAMLAIERRNGQPVFAVIDDGGRVVAAAITEGVGHPGTLGLVATGLAQMPRIINLFSVLAENHPKEPHLYLQVLGCDPPFQGKGYGKALLDRLALEAKARPEIQGVYLETAKEANVAFYASKGYEVLGELYPLGVKTWRMYQRKRQG